jgi:hypothetical protein
MGRRVNRPNARNNQPRTDQTLGSPFSILEKHFVTLRASFVRNDIRLRILHGHGSVLVSAILELEGLTPWLYLH